METIIVLLDSQLLDNPDLDMVYDLPDQVETYTSNEIQDNGYDYIGSTKIGIWLQTKSAQNSYEKVLEVLRKYTFCDNDLSKTAKIYISTQETAPLEECTLVYNGNEK